LEQRKIFVILFDELDYNYLYKKGNIRRAYPNIGAFASISDNYHRAIAPGESSLDSILGLIVGRSNLKVEVDGRGGLGVYEVLNNGEKRVVNIGKENIFELARNKGFKTKMYGWLHPYCNMMYKSLDNCRSFSVYNFSTVNSSISLVNPVFTNIMLWPRQLPFGLLKNPIYSIYQDKLVSRTYNLATSTLNKKEAIFEFVHFSIPHLPFVYDGEQYRPAQNPFLQNDENYVKQVKYVDHIFGRFVSDLKDHGKFSNSVVIILSDHPYRVTVKGKKEIERRKVPLIVKRVRGNVRKDIYEMTKTEILLRSIIEGRGEKAEPA